MSEGRRARLGLLDDVATVGFLGFGAGDEDAHFLFGVFGVGVMVGVWGAAVALKFVAVVGTFSLVPFADFGF